MNGKCHLACGQPSDQGRLKKEEKVVISKTNVCTSTVHSSSGPVLSFPKSTAAESDGVSECVEVNVPLDT